MAQEIGVMGSEEFVLGFQLAGIRRVATTATSDAFQDAMEDVLAKRRLEDVGILIVDARDVDTLSATTKRKVTETIEPVIVQMGGKGGDLRDKVKRAIGIDVYKE